LSMIWVSVFWAYRLPDKIAVTRISKNVFML
jgi:hypothetical protein